MSSTVHRLRLTFYSLALLYFVFCVIEAETFTTHYPIESRIFENNNKGSCNCSNSNPCKCTCRDIFSAESLNNKSHYFPQCRDFELLLEHSVLHFLPHRLFSKIVQPARLHLKLNNSTVYLLSLHSETHSPFQNLRFEKIDISVQRSSTLTGWKWEVLKNLLPTKNGLLSFYAVKTELLYLPDEFSSAAQGEIYAVRILECRLRWLGKRVFAPLHKLHILELRYNSLQEITRSQLPEVPSKLTILDLGNNRLTHIPHDLFEGLPLKTFHIDGNHIKCLDPNIIARCRNLGLSDILKMPVCKKERQNDQKEGVLHNSI